MNWLDNEHPQMRGMNGQLGGNSVSESLLSAVWNYPIPVVLGVTALTGYALYYFLLKK